MTKDLRGEKYIDSRDLLKRLEELRSLKSEADEEHREFDEDLWEELNHLIDIEGDLPSDGETLIREDEFENYARELAHDIGAVSNEDQWPNTCIDWERAADELKADYTTIEFGGFTYQMRSC